jgi:hypothetical protein
LPGELEARSAFVAHYNRLRHHESIDIPTLVPMSTGAVKLSCWEKGSNANHPTPTLASQNSRSQNKLNAPDLL